MKKIIAILVLAIALVNISLAQTDEEPKKKRVKINRDVMLGDELKNSGSYYNAIDVYLKSYSDDPTNYTANQLAKTYFLARDYKNAETWYKKSWETAGAAYPDAQYYYALSMKMNGKYELAKTEFKAFSKSKLKGSMAPILKRQAKNELKGCDLALALMAEPLAVEVDHLNKNINNNYTDFSPTYDPTNNKLIYASLVSEEIIDLGSTKKVELKSRIFESSKQGENWAKGTQMDVPMNKTSAHTGNGTYSPDAKRFYFTECEPNDSLKMICKIYVSEYKSGKWNDPKVLSDVNEAGFNTTHPAVGTYKGKELLYFSTNRSGGRGGMDIWYSEIRGNGSEYTTPQNCGTKINTTGDEITPFFSQKENLLYFSSNGLINIGGFDVYKTEGGLKSWDAALNVGYPINSSVDDFYYSVDTKKARTGFLVSNRAGGYSVKSETCCDDIYAFEYIVPPVFTIMGRVINSKDNQVVDGAAVTLLKTGGQADVAVSNATKMFLFYRGSEFEKYTVTAIKDGFYKGEAKLSTVGLLEDDTLYVDVIMDPIPIKIDIEIKNIYYELAKAELRPESFLALDSLYNILSNNPAIIVEIGSHTDSRDSKERNQDLSQRRAQSVVTYMVGKGIDSTRLLAKGYGELKLKNKCADGAKCSEEEHAINRRTEFTIVGEIPNTNIKYNQSEIDALKALEREKEEKIQADKNKRLMDLQQVEEGEETGAAVIENTETKTTETKTTTKEEKKPKEEVKVDNKAALDATVIKKGNLYEGNAMVNGTVESKYMLNLNPSVTVTMMSDEFYAKLKAAGKVSDADFKNDKPTTISDGSLLKGDVFTLKSLQLGDALLQNIDCKINLTSTQNIVVGVKVVETSGCSFDTKNLKYKCK